MGSSWRIVALCIGLVLAGFGGCSDENESVGDPCPDTEAPRVVLTHPLGSTVQVPSLPDILPPGFDRDDDYMILLRLQFSKPMDLATVAAAVRFEPDLDYEISETGSQVIYIAATTSADLLLQSSYRLTILDSAASLDGIRLAEPFAYEFATGPLAVVSADPNPGSVVPPANIYQSFHFNAPLSPIADLASLITIDPPVAQAPYIDLNGGGIRLDWGTPLRAATEYTFELPAILMDRHGSALPTAYQYRFTTEPVACMNADVETVEMAMPVYIRFNTAMDSASVHEAVSTPAGVEIDDDGWGGASNFGFRPANRYWPANSHLLFSISTQAEDVYGDHLLAPRSITMETPAIAVQTYPPDGAPAVSRYQWLYLYFNTAMDRASVEAAIDLNIDGETTIWWSETGDGDGVSMRLASGSWPPDTDVTFTLSTLATDTYGVPLDDAITTTFHTVN